MSACKSIASVYSNTQFKKFVNVYQTKFVDFAASGIGDYLRGSLTMMQLLRTLKTYTGTDVAFDMDFRNHPIGKFIVTDDTLEKPDSYPALGNFHIDSLLVVQDENDIAYQHILREVVGYFNGVSLPTLFAYCCKEHVYEEILDSEKAFIRSRMIPTPQLEDYIGSSMVKLGVTSGEYVAIHVRLDDDICFPHTAGPNKAVMTAKLLDEIVTSVRTNVLPDKKYVLISSSVDVKTALTGGNIYSLPTAICHIGQNQSQTDDETRDTLLDFFLLSRASRIVAFTTYSRTGFSLECSKIYGVPYEVFVHKQPVIMPNMASNTA